MNKCNVANNSEVRIGLALSGGGSRAIAFHLGCLRALNDRGILDRVKIISTVSGGSVIGALYAFSNDSFEQFDERVMNLLSRGITSGILRTTFFSGESIKIVFTILISGLIALIMETLTLFTCIIEKLPIRISTKFQIVNFKKYLVPFFRRYSSRTTAFSRYLEENFFKDINISDISRENLNIVINATELTTQSAIRFGSLKSRCWRIGEIVDTIPVSKAVAASAAYPLFLPALDENFVFKNNECESKHRVIITDGGVYDNFGTSYFFSKSPKSTSEKANFLIVCTAGQGLVDGKSRPYSWFTRVVHSLNVHSKRPENMMMNLLFEKQEKGEIKGFIMPYLGQKDENLPCAPTDLVPREKVINYPTNFSALRCEDINLLAKRGEQLTNNLIDTHHPDLLIS